MAKKIVYLIGAGATQAEADYQVGVGKKVNLLMRNDFVSGEQGVCARILKKARKDESLNLPDEEYVDIEKVISLFAASGREKHRKNAETLRKYYYKDILNGLTKEKISNKPELAMGVLEMHDNVTFKKHEDLAGIISLNHDNLFEIACQLVHGKINLGFNFYSECFGQPENGTPLILKLHGSFNWQARIPIKVKQMHRDNEYNKDILWIPPAILKETKEYPYNKLSALAYELLSSKCDILRIVGCSLSQNDWNIVSMIFNAQYHQLLTRKECFKIQLIMDPSSCDKIKDECSYLWHKIPIGQLKDGNFNPFLNKKLGGNQKLANPFHYWLKEKVKFHKLNKEISFDDRCQKLKKITGVN